MNLRRVFSLWLLLAASVTGIVVTPTPAGAEITVPQQTSWGLADEGATNNIANWDSLGWAVEQVGGMMLAGGKFLNVTNGSNTINQSWIAAFDAGTGTVLPWWRPDVGGAVLTIENSPDGGVFVGGEMGDWNGIQLGALVKIDPATGELWPGFNTRVFGGNSVVRDIRLENDGWLYVVGSFTTASANGNPQPVSGAIRINPNTGAIDQNWIPMAQGGSVWGVSVSALRNEVYLTGWFTSINNAASTDGFAGVSSTNGSVLRNRTTIPYNTCVGCSNNYRLYDVVATEFGDIWVAGEQHALFILDETDLNMDLMHYTGCDLNQQPNCQRRGGEFQEIERAGDRIYAGGHFWGSHLTDTEIIYLTGQFPTGTPTGTVSAVAAYDVQTRQRIQAFNPYMSGDAGSFGIALASDGCLWLTGGINTVGLPGSQQSARDLARLCDSAGPGPDPQPNPAPPPAVACTATANGDLITLNWTVPAEATDTVIERAVNAGNYNWRGVVAAPGTQFSENGSSGNLNTYRVRAKYTAGWVSATTQCDPPIDLGGGGVNVAPPATCAASNSGTAATITWAASADAVDYRVYRSVNGGNTWWRGITQTTSFSDTLQSSGTHQYTVQARGVDGVWSTSTTCLPPLDPQAGGGGSVDPPATCAASNSGTAATISWDASAGATDYRVYRSVNGGNTWWRGITQTTSFNDTLQGSGSHQYTVQARGVDGVWSVSTVCSPPLDPTAGQTADPVASCTAAVVGGGAEITWPASAQAVNYRIYRSVGGGNTFWRGVTSNLVFNDSLVSGQSHLYSVQARGADGVWSASTICSPPIVGP